MLQGAGVDTTVIRVPDNSAEEMLVVNGPTGLPFRVTGFTFEWQRSSDDGNSNTYAFKIRDAPHRWRIDHNRFVLNTAVDGALHHTAGIYDSVDAESYGLIDDNSFDGKCRMLFYGDGDASWKLPLSFGTADAVFVESNHCDGPVTSNFIDNELGSRLVVRHNDIRGSNVISHGFKGARGMFSMEIYGNSFHEVEAMNVELRSGTAVVYDNEFLEEESWEHGNDILVRNDRSCGLPDWCDGTNPLDGNESDEGYPCRDQVGRSTDSSAAEVLPQAHEPVYQWNNTWNAADPVAIHVNGALCDGGGRQPQHMQQGRDYFDDQARPGYTAYPYPHPLTLLPR